MKQLKVLPLVAIISGLMVGCGGGGGGGGGGGTPQTAFNFTFVAPKTQALSSNGTCTIYDRFESNNIEQVLNYHKLGGVLDTQLTAYYSDASGNRVGDLVTASNDKLTIILQTIPDGGSVTVQEVNGTIINAITFSKDLLESESSLRNVYLSADANVSNTSCLTGNNDSKVNKTNLDYKTAEGASGNPYSTFYFDSQLETVTANESRFTKGESLPAVSTEKTMVAQYRTASRSSLFQYGFEDWTDGRMVFAGTPSMPMVSTSGINFSKIDIDTIYKNFSYRLAEVPKTSAFYHPDALKGDVWTFSVEGTIATPGWTAAYTDKVSENWSIVVDDRSLFSVTDTQNTKPGVSNSVVDLTDSIGLGQENGLQRVSYQQGTMVGATPYVVRHSVYSLIEGSIVVPDLDYSSVPSGARSDLVISNNSLITQSYVFTDEKADVKAADFLTAFANGDGADTTKDVLGIVMNEKQVRDTMNRIAQTKTLMLERSN
ncbi:flagellar sheath protein A [Vibrio parahaemolyticus]|uniref:flagellar sheath protein A n=1 Tax=Vibrio parahaemolyticus TaxID=670 RepID=UPI001120D470|nr:flagellar sheath protein A [Vibrio parahaemolyticus]TOP16589.1 flagellar sheath protein A [Vibrio parahaemolyticus]TOQ52433.1 flagellar sheath protein A [Vibrio parahaemolyticus]HCG7541808.1 flagellar sheath protein A [Vibrio parahaemolyticus]HCH0356295.1 flagellar sheath protein A [Vibrio parahaemolyticus]HCH5748615.1 flagellar sheath protein A [Vibrio parahaemolyticus]